MTNGPVLVRLLLGLKRARPGRGTGIVSTMIVPTMIPQRVQQIEALGQARQALVDGLVRNPDFLALQLPWNSPAERARIEARLANDPAAVALNHLLKALDALQAPEAWSNPPARVVNHSPPVPALESPQVETVAATEPCEQPPSHVSLTARIAMLTPAMPSEAFRTRVKMKPAAAATQPAPFDPVPIGGTSATAATRTPAAPVLAPAQIASPVRSPPHAEARPAPAIPLAASISARLRFLLDDSADEPVVNHGVPPSGPVEASVAIVRRDKPAAHCVATPTPEHSPSPASRFTFRRLLGSP
jgi:hypothetical protein